MDYPQGLASREFARYMYRPYGERSDFYLETLLFVAWVLMMVIIVNIYKCISKCAHGQHLLQKPRYMTAKSRTLSSRYQKSVNSIAN